MRHYCSEVSPDASLAMAWSAGQSMIWNGTSWVRDMMVPDKSLNIHDATHAYILYICVWSLHYI